MTSPDERLLRLIDKDAVADVVRRYAYGIDVRDGQMVGSCFDRDARIDGTVFAGSLGEYLPRLLAAVRVYGATMHHLGTQLIEVEGDVATAQTYAIAHHFRDAAGTEEDLVVGVRYDDRLRRGADRRWRIVERTVKSMWRRESGPPEEHL